MKVGELRELLDERSDKPPDEVMNHLRLAGVRAKIRGRRRRRALLLLALAALLVVGAGTLALVPLGGSSPAPASAPSTIGGFPEYAFGAHVISAESARLPVRRITLAVTVNSNPDLVVLTRCGDLSLEVQLTLDGNVLASGPCQPGATRPLGLRKDRTSALVLTVLDAPPGSSAEYGVAVARPMAFPEYPLPPRPSSVKPLAVRGDETCAARPCGEPIVLRSDEHDPLRPVVMKITWTRMRSVQAVSQTPGHLAVTIGGIALGTGTWWSYDQTVVPFTPSVQIAAGTDVTVAIEPEYVTGAWQVVLTPEP